MFLENAISVFSALAVVFVFQGSAIKMDRIFKAIKVEEK
jgi:hypothetical protein